MTASASTAAFAAALTVFGPGSQTVAVAPATVEGEGSRAVAKAIIAAIERGEYETVRLQGDCEDTDCWRTAASEADAFMLVAPRVTEANGDHQIVIDALRVADAELVSTVEDTCDLCGKSELLEMGEDLGGRMRRSLDRMAGKPGVLALASAPQGATVFVDGEEVGVTPLDHTLDPGTHELRLEHPGHEPLTRTVDVVGGTREVASFRLAPKPTAPPTPPEGPGRDRARPLVGAGAGLLALGAIGLAIGGALVAIHGSPILNDCSDDNIDPDGDCRFLRNTRGGGIGLLVAGGVSLIAGAVLLGVGLKRRKTDRRTAFSGSSLTLTF